MNVTDGASIRLNGALLGSSVSPHPERLTPLSTSPPRERWCGCGIGMGGIGVIMKIREIEDRDLAAVIAIYAHHVLTGFGSFEETPPTADEMGRRVAAVRALGLPWLVAEVKEAGVVGYAYAAAFRPRPGYRFTAEDSVYVAPDAGGRGIGRALLGGVIDRCQAMGLRQLLAVIGDSGNAASIGLHRALGFDLVGIAPGVGFKHGRWVDIVWMRRAMNDGDRSAPEGEGLKLAGLTP